MRVRGFLMVGAMVGALLPAGGLAPVAGAAEPAQACPESVPRAGFRDVASTNVHRDSVNCAVWWEMARGTSRTRFAPGRSVSRGQMATFVAKMILRSGGELPASPGDVFRDDEHSAHHYNINRLAKAGIVAGAQGRYRPDALVTRAQMATFLVRAYQYRTAQQLAAEGDAFDDDDGSLHETNINKAAAAGFTSGAGGGTYAPAADVLRAQMATFVTNALEGVVDTGQVNETPATLRQASALRSFDECEPLLGHLKERGVEEVGPYGWNGFGIGIPEPMADDDTSGGGGPAAGAPESGSGTDSRAGVDYSDTNTQEAGVDEADVVKTDGRIVVSMLGSRLRVVDVTGDQPRLVGSLAMPNSYDAQLLLRGTKALVLSTDYGWDDMPRPVDTIDIAPREPGGSERGPRAVVTLVDLADPAAPRIESTLQTDGSMVSTRMVDGIARIVVRAGAPALDFQYPQHGTEEAHREAAQHNRLVVENSTIEDWLPTYRLTDGSGAVTSEGALMDCTELRRPPEYSGLGSINVLTVDMAGELEPGRATGVLAGGEIVYASPTSLYVATTKWGPWAPEPLVETSTTTEIHKFSITDPAAAQYVASGKVPGFMLNQFSMSELDGNLRTATTSQPSWWGGGDVEESSSQVVVLAQSGETLTTIGQVGGLGRGEQIFAVRFIGDQGYVVTFRQTDPLYTIDLSNPAAPRVAGELKILGYSAYLHPVGDGLLLGVGQDANAEGQTQGTQLSLFDVSDPAAPTRVAQATLASGTYSDAEFDHHAFLHWPATGTTVLPISRYSYDEETQTEDYFVGAAGFDVDSDAITQIGEITHGHPSTGEDGESEAWPGIRRSLVIDGVVYTLSERGLKGSNMTTLADESWTPFDR